MSPRNNIPFNNAPSRGNWAGFKRFSRVVFLPLSLSTQCTEIRPEVSFKGKGRDSAVPMPCSVARHQIPALPGAGATCDAHPFLPAPLHPQRLGGGKGVVVVRDKRKAKVFTGKHDAEETVFSLDSCDFSPLCVCSPSFSVSSCVCCPSRRDLCLK